MTGSAKRARNPVTLDELVLEHRANREATRHLEQFPGRVRTEGIPLLRLVLEYLERLPRSKPRQASSRQREDTLELAYRTLLASPSQQAIRLLTDPETFLAEAQTALEEKHQERSLETLPERVREQALWPVLERHLDELADHLVAARGPVSAARLLAQNLLSALE